MILVADSSPLIALARIGRLELLHTLFGTLMLPDAVWGELVATNIPRVGANEIAAAEWIEHRPVSDDAWVKLLRQDLGAGESEAIVLAKEINADLLLIDERRGRTAAKSLGLNVTGLVGILIEARKQELLPDADNIGDELVSKAGFWLSYELRRLIAREESSS